jgi:hypothetical protein
VNKITGAGSSSSDFEEGEETQAYIVLFFMIHVPGTHKVVQCDTKFSPVQEAVKNG